LGSSRNFEVAYEDFLVGASTNKLLVVGSKMSKRAVICLLVVVTVVFVALGAVVAALWNLPGGIALAGMFLVPSSSHRQTNTFSSCPAGYCQRFHRSGDLPVEALEGLRASSYPM
jgi:hypothetical protein